MTTSKLLSEVRRVIARSGKTYTDATWNQFHKEACALFPADPHPTAASIATGWWALQRSGWAADSNLARTHTSLCAAWMALSGSVIDAGEFFDRGTLWLPHEDDAEAVNVTDEASRHLAVSFTWAAAHSARALHSIAQEKESAGVRRACKIVAAEAAEIGGAASVDMLAGLVAEVTTFAKELARLLMGAPLPPLRPASVDAAYTPLLSDSEAAGGLVWDLALARLLESERYGGGVCLDTAASIRRRANERLASRSDITLNGHTGPGVLWCQWVDPCYAAGGAGVPWVSAVAFALWHDIVAERFIKAASAQSAPPTVPLGKGYKPYFGSGFSLIPERMADIGQFAVDDISSKDSRGGAMSTYLTQIEAGDGFVEVPENVADSSLFASQGAVLLHRKGRRMQGADQIAFSFGGQDDGGGPSGIVEALASGQISPEAGKLATIAMAMPASRRHRSLAQAHPDEWIALLRGTGFDKSGAMVSRAIRRSDDTWALAESLADLFGFVLWLPGGVAALAYQVKVFNPAAVTPETQVGIGCSSALIDAAPDIAGPTKGRRDMLFDMRRFLALQGKGRALDMRLMLTAYRKFNRAGNPGNGVYEQRRMKWQSQLELAAECNALSMPAVKGLLAPSPSESDTRRTRRDTAALEARLGRAMNRGIIGEVREKGRGKRKLYSLRASDEYIELNKRAAAYRAERRSKP